MWWAGSDAPGAYLGLQSAALWSSDSAEKQWIHAESTLAAFEALLQRTSQHRRRFGRSVLNLQVSGALARPFVFEAIAGLKSRDEAEQVASTMAADATGLAGPCIVWLDDVPEGANCLAVAMEKVLRDELEARARTHQVRLRALRPWWCDAVRNVASTGALAALDPDALTILIGDNTCYTRAATHVPAPTAEQHRALLARWAMSANVNMDDIAQIHFDDLPI